jgi:hypothetical protein
VRGNELYFFSILGLSSVLLYYTCSTPTERIRLIYTSSDAREEFQVDAGFLTHLVHLEMLSQNGAISSGSPSSAVVCSDFVCSTLAKYAGAASSCKSICMFDDSRLGSVVRLKQEGNITLFICLSWWCWSVQRSCGL